VRALVLLGSASIPRIAEVGLDFRVAGVAAALSIATGVIFGLVPLARPSDRGTAQVLREDARGASAGARLGRARNVLVASEYALALVLLVGAGLLLRSFVALQALDSGFDAHNVLSMVVSVQDSPEGVPGRRAAFYRDVLDRARALPGVEAAGGINHLPIGGDIWGLSFFIEGQPRPEPGEKANATYRVVLPGYFETMRLPLLRGRAIDERDDESAQPVVVINESLANRYWPGEDAIGRRISFPDPQTSARWLTVVGVTKNAVQYDWADAPAPELYLPLFQTQDYLDDPSSHYAYITLVARTAGDPAKLAPALRNVVWSINRDLPIAEVRTMEGVVSEATAQPRFNAALLAGFAAVALALAAVGIYGVMSYVVARRTREIGIRMALGARESQIIALVVKQGMLTAAAGAAVGLVAAFLMRTLMSSLLYGIGPADPATFTVVPALPGLVALLASWVPARRALAMNPVSALRDD
jgi:putative ABC transport system permease protein